MRTRLPVRFCFSQALCLNVGVNTIGCMLMHDHTDMQAFMNILLTF